MRTFIRYSLLMLTAIGTVGLLCMLLLLTAMAAPPDRNRTLGQARWESLAINNYRASVRIEYRGENCFQQIEVRFGAAHALRNTCNTGWLSLMSVPELFELAEQIEEIPPTRCYPSARWCICQRAFTLRTIEYDPDYGYPAAILSRSELRPNWTGLDFWQRILQSTNLPTCGPAPRRLTVHVLALTPMP